MTGHHRPSAALALSGAALLVAISLGVRWNALLSGYVLDVRVLLVAAIVGLVAAARGTAYGRALTAVVIGLLVLALGLHIRSIEPTALFLVAGAIVATAWARPRLS